MTGCIVTGCIVPAATCFAIDINTNYPPMIEYLYHINMYQLETDGHCFQSP